MAPSDTTEKVWMPPLAIARQKKNSRLRRIGPDSSSSSPPCCRPCGRWRGLARRPRQQIAGDHQQDGGGERQGRGDQEPALPAPDRHRGDHHGGRHAAAEIAREGMDRERLAHALAVDRGRQDRIVGRVIDSVGDAEQGIADQEHPVARQQGRDADRDAAQVRPPVSMTRAPILSTRKPAGVCSSADITL